MISWDIFPEELIGSFRMRHETEYATIFARESRDSLYRTVIFISWVSIFIEVLDSYLTIPYELSYLKFTCSKSSFRTRYRYNEGVPDLYSRHPW